MGGGRAGLLERPGLTAAEVSEAEPLLRACDAHEELALPLDLEPSEPGDDPASRHLLYYESGALLGYLHLTGLRVPPSRHPAEVCGMVHPDQRRRGIGRRLLDAAGDLCRQHGVPRWNLVADEAGVSGKSFAAAVGGRFRLAEHRLLLDPAAVPPPEPRPEPLALRRATPDDIPVAARIGAAAFGDSPDAIAAPFTDDLRHPDRRLYLAAREGAANAEAIGCLRVVPTPSGVYITAFAVLPEHQGRGYGRQILLRTVATLLSEGWPTILIEVEAENRHALALYRACGFREIRSYGFYELPL